MNYFLIQNTSDRKSFKVEVRDNRSEGEFIRCIRDFGKLDSVYRVAWLSNGKVMASYSRFGGFRDWRHLRLSISLSAIFV